MNHEVVTQMFRQHIDMSFLKVKELYNRGDIFAKGSGVNSFGALRFSVDTNEAHTVMGANVFFFRVCENE